MIRRASKNPVRGLCMFPVVVLFAACGSTATVPDPTPDAGVDASPADASADVKDASADAADTAPVVPPTRCTSGPQEGVACAATDVACAATDLCCSGGFTWKCAGGTWAKSTGVACDHCAGTPCGATPCPGNQFCIERKSGTPGGASTFTCQPYPAGCADDWSCDCVAPTVTGCAGLSGTCTENPARHVKLTCQGV